jgi:hypothetical protein
MGATMTQLNEYNHSSDSEKKKEDWMNSKWRPMMGWMYMFVCLFDFVIAPIGWTSIQALFHGGINTQWQPLTLQGGGLFHVAMGAVIGISAYGRTKEKLEGVNNDNGMHIAPGMGTQYVPPGGMPGGMGMNNGMGGGFGGQQGGMGGGFGGQQGGMGGGFGGQQGGMGSGFNSGGFGGQSSGGFGGQSSGGFGGTTPAAPASGGFGGTTPAAPASGGFGSGFNSGSGTTPAAMPAVNAAGKKVIPTFAQPAL